jgi:hypothetical protein
MDAKPRYACNVESPFQRASIYMHAHALLKSKEEPAGPNFFADVFDRPAGDIWDAMHRTKSVVVKDCLIVNLIF